MKNWFSFVDVVVPPSCLFCGDLVSAAVDPLCVRCAPSLPSSVSSVQCRKPIVTCWSLGPYAGFLGALIRSAKYRRSMRAADQLGAWLGAGLLDVMDVDLVVHVPTVWYRRAYRGFDPAERIALGVASALGVPHSSLLRRRGHSRQVGKTAADRRELSAHSFLIRGSVCPERVLLVDDVVTTGATLRAAAVRLKGHGASHIYAASVAHS